jgi:two-component system response regulator RegA
MVALMAARSVPLRRGYQVKRAAGLVEVPALRLAHRPQYAVVNLKLAAVASGLRCIQLLHAHDALMLMLMLMLMLIVVLIGYASIATAVEAIKLEARHHLAKPANTDDIEEAFARAQCDTAVALTARTTSVKTLEGEHIHEALAAADFNISDTARRLGMHRHTLAGMLEKQRIK